MTTQGKRERRDDRVRTAGERSSAHRGLPAIGLESEFTVMADGTPRRPEELFGSPPRIIRGPIVHRTGQSYHLPTGGALYFDTGVVEIATPMIELAPGCGARATRSLWESLAFLRDELDAWQVRAACEVRLAGFSTHYNVSFDLPRAKRAQGRSVERLAYLLTYILAAPVMLLSANRRSTGVGVRPRGNRIEVTADFTPDAALMAAAATLIVGIVREVMAWPRYDLRQLDAHGLPAVSGFRPAVHSSRTGWVARYSCFPQNPFTSDVNGAQWMSRDGRRMSLREMARLTTERCWRSIGRYGDPRSLRIIAAVMGGRVPSLLELDDRPTAYDDVGRLCRWNDLFSDAQLSRSRYERVLGNAISGRRVRFDGEWHRPVGMQGWAHVVFRRERDNARCVRSLDDMLVHLGAWDRSTERRSDTRRRRSATGEGEVERRDRERRLEKTSTAPPASDREVPLPTESDDAVPAAAPRDRRNEAPLVIIARSG